MDYADMFDIRDTRVAVTGAAGILLGEVSRGLAQLGAKVAILDFNLEGAQQVAGEINDAGGSAVAVHCNVLEPDSVQSACAATVDKLGGVDVLINGAGGNKKEATCVPPTTFFELDPDAMRWVFDLNCVGTILPSQVFGRHFAEQGAGNIINTSSMSGFHPLTNVVGYSAAKAAVGNFTEWLAVYMAQRHDPGIRVNAIAPGFFLTEQNRFLLTDEKTGEPTARGKLIIDNTPAGRYGTPEELVGTVVWLMSEASRFVTGIVVPIDGGFNAFSGV
jgi:NAD(P)-dependent dehydrogenase (short-subunit alcohol dehydrogenase family)